MSMGMTAIIAWSTFDGQYKRDVARLANPKILENLGEHFTGKQMVQLLFSLGEASEIWAIFEALHPTYASILEKRLADILSGPVGAADEKTQNSSNRARNTQFELHLMAQLVIAGFPLLDNTLTDVQSRFADRDVLIECKRPQRVESIRACIRDALHQLKRESQVNSTGSLKFAALSLSKAITGGADLWKVADEHEGNAVLEARIGEIMKPHARFFGHQAGSDIAGALVYATASILRVDSGSPGNITQQVFFPNPAASSVVERQAADWFAAFSKGIRARQEG